MVSLFVDLAYSRCAVNLKCILKLGVLNYRLNNVNTLLNYFIVLIAGNYNLCNCNSFVDNIVYHKSKGVGLNLCNGGICIEIINSCYKCLYDSGLLAAIENFSYISYSFSYNDVLYSCGCCFLAVADLNVCKDILYSIDDFANPAVSVKVLV